MASVRRNPGSEGDVAGARSILEFAIRQIGKTVDREPQGHDEAERRDKFLKALEAREILVDEPKSNENDWEFGLVLHRLKGDRLPDWGVFDEALHRPINHSDTKTVFGTISLGDGSEQTVLLGHKP